ncbi:hypothetical protein BOX15_Mlig009799g3 [Macrostomum lignano]|uniref:Uncharacterized protein n=2 Tax=Macrostomum lignano TaxID=282301 RepID=A0A267GD58_9PLAT|nr:hypothetical protein BOX15_Mlig009799g3 [Macrostomum lignano]
MQQAIVTRTCRPCGRQFTTQTGTFELQGKNPGQQQQQQQQQQESQSEESRTRGQLKPLRLALADWNVFPETTVLAPQQAEGVVCNWLQTTAAQMKLLDDESRLYGKVIFDPLGELYDFEISTLSPKMLSPGFGNWMSTLASGEVLLDIVNCLIDHCLPAAVGRNEAGNIFEIITAEPLKKVRLLDVAPNQLAACMFLGNHNRLIDDFLDPLLASVRDIGLPPPGEKPGTAGNIRQALHLIRPVGHNLLRSCHSTREWTWKALMLLVLILMALCGSLTAEQEHLFSCLTGEFDASQLVVPELQLALSAIQQAAKGITVAEQPSVQELRWALPYRRVMKQGPIDFQSVLLRDFELE